MRLRPSGNQGPVATSFKSFTLYQREQAWVWEHLALTRARPVGGAPELMADVDAFRQDLLKVPRQIDPVLREVANMRARIASAKPATSIWDAKIGPGRLQDIELIAQAGALLGGSAKTDVGSGLQSAVASGWLNVADADVLRQSYELCWSLQSAMRLMSGKTITVEHLGQGGLEFLCRTTGQGDIDQLRAALERAYCHAAAIIDAVLPQVQETDKND